VEYVESIKSRDQARTCRREASWYQAAATKWVASLESASLCIQAGAVLTKSIVAIAYPALILRNVAPRRTTAIVVIDPAISRFLNFVHRIELGYSRHDTSPPTDTDHSPAAVKYMLCCARLTCQPSESEWRR
jgi:hypothetical protein